MGLLDEILATGLPLTDHDAVAATLSVGRTKLVRTEIGKGAVIETIGLASGNSLLDVIDNVPDYRHVKQLLANGWFNVGSELARSSLEQLVIGGVITAPEADALKALAMVADPVTPTQVAQALEGVL